MEDLKKRRCCPSEPVPVLGWCFDVYQRPTRRRWGKNALLHEQAGVRLGGKMMLRPQSDDATKPERWIHDITGGRRDE